MKRMLFNKLGPKDSRIGYKALAISGHTLFPIHYSGIALIYVKLFAPSVFGIVGKEGLHPSPSTVYFLGH